MSTPVTNPRGTFCILIEQQIAISNCPLPRGTCMWKHRISGLCMYDENVESLDANAYAALVGLPPINAHLVNILKRSVVAIIKEELAN